jgi:hypothetical protein
MTIKLIILIKIYTPKNYATINMKSMVVSGRRAFIETTKASVLVAESKVHSQQQFLQQQLTKSCVAYSKRDPELSLDFAALNYTEAVCSVDCLIKMGSLIYKLTNVKK